MKNPLEAIEIVNLDHLGIVAGVIDEMELVEEVNKKVGLRAKEAVSPGQVMKAMILNGLGFLSAPLYLFENFFVGKATEHLIGEGVIAEQLNDDRIGRALDKYYEVGTTNLFTAIALKAAQKFQVEKESVHLDSSSISVEGEYKSKEEENQEIEEEMKAIKIVHGYSRDKRPDLKQFIIDMVVSGDGDVPLYLKIDDGNADDKSVFVEKGNQEKTIVYQVTGEIEPRESVIEAEKIKAGRFILATNILDKKEVSNEKLLAEYKAQQSNERGFRFLKDPLFFTASVFVKKPERVEAIAMIMGLCLLVYNLAQRKLRKQLETAQEWVRNQVKKLTNKPTMRWIFQMFQAVHLVRINGENQVSNLTQERQEILQHLGKDCCQYYLMIPGG